MSWGTLYPRTSVFAQHLQASCLKYLPHVQYLFCFSAFLLTGIFPVGSKLGICLLVHRPQGRDPHFLYSLWPLPMDAVGACK